MDIKYNFVSDNYKKKNINLIFIESRNQQADVLTKGLPAIAFNKFRNLLGLKDLGFYSNVARKRRRALRIERVDIVDRALWSAL